MRKRDLVAATILIAALVYVGTANARTSGIGCESMDVNHDQKITATDALLVLRASVGLDGCN